MFKTLYAFLVGGLISIVGFAVANSAEGQSLFQKRRDSRLFIYRDVKARKTGDLLTVLVQVKSDVSNQNRKQMNKTTDADANGDFGYSGSAGANSLRADYTTDSARSSSGSSTQNLANTFTDRFTVAVLDVQPNGNLVIGGKRRIQVDGEERVIVMTGIVRAIDIEHDNTVNSPLVADLSVRYEGNGPSKYYTRQGWLSKKMNRIWPF